MSRGLLWETEVVTGCSVVRDLQRRGLDTNRAMVPKADVEDDGGGGHGGGGGGDGANRWPAYRLRPDLGISPPRPAGVHYSIFPGLGPLAALKGGCDGRVP